MQAIGRVRSWLIVMFSCWSAAAVADDKERAAEVRGETRDDRCHGTAARRFAISAGHGLAAFVAGENLFDRRYLVGRAGIDTFGAPRTMEAGLALDRH
jgi:hypothetical protein